MKRVSRLRNAAIFSLGLVFFPIATFTGCFLQKSSQQPKRIEEIRPNPPIFKSYSLTIQRRDFKSQLGRAGENTIRLVPVFQSAVNPESFVHRVFDVRPKSIYTLMGIKNADILVAVDGYLVKKPEQFVSYVELLQNEDSSTIEILRGGESILLRYNLIPSVKVAAVAK
jgi:type II secretory pathway component PulC